jgi:hypothetical protein
MAGNAKECALLVDRFCDRVGVGMMARVFQPTPLAAVLASLTWRTLLAQLQRLTTHHVQQRPEGE